MKLFIPLLVAGAIIATPAAQILVLRSGERIELSGELRRDGDRVVFRSRVGTLYSLPASEIDEKATRAAITAEPEAASKGRLPRRLKGDEATKRRLLADLSKSRGTRVPPPLADPPPTPASSPESEAAKLEVEAAREEMWRREARAFDARVADAEQRIRNLAERERALNDAILGMMAMGHPQEHLGLQVRALQDTKSYLEQAKRDLERATRERSAFQEDARRRGILPGWLR
jgi:hypothetical protein